MIKTHFGYWDIVFGIWIFGYRKHYHGGKRLHNETCRMDYLLHQSPIRYVISSWSLLLGPIHGPKSTTVLVLGDDPPTIRNTRNLHPGTRSRIEKHEIPTYCTNLHNSWLLHLGVFLYLCIARSFGGNANSWFSFPMFRLKTKTNPSLEKNLKILKLP